jgi:hypothetical protein
MFRLPDFLTSEMVVCNGLKLLAFGTGHIGGYRLPGEDTTNYRYRNVILTTTLRQHIQFKVIVIFILCLHFAFFMIKSPGLIELDSAVDVSYFG